MNDNNCNTNHIISYYELNFLKIEDDTCYSYDRYASIFLDEINVEIHFDMKTCKNVIDLIVQHIQIRFEWFGKLKDFDKWVTKINSENDYTKLWEYKILEYFLVFAESITNKNIIYAEKRASDRIKYDLR